MNYHYPSNGLEKSTTYQSLQGKNDVAMEISTWIITTMLVLAIWSVILPMDSYLCGLKTS